MSDKPSTSQPNTLDNSTDKVTVSVHFYSTVRNTTGISHIEKIVPKKTILRDLLTEIEKELFLPKKSHFLKSDQSDVEPGIICLLDEADIHINGGIKQQLRKDAKVTLISSLHGG